MRQSLNYSENKIGKKLLRAEKVKEQHAKIIEHQQVEEYMKKSKVQKAIGQDGPGPEKQHVK